MTIVWVSDSGAHHHDVQPEDVTREEFDEIRRRQNELMERVEFVEAQVRAIAAKEYDGDA